MKGNMQKLNNTIGNKTNCKRKMRREGESQSTRNQKGITLVALVITIIVIIILSTVAINFIFGDNGLIRQAEQARDYYANDTEYTDDSLTNIDSYIDEIVNGEEDSLLGNVKWVGYGNRENCYILDDRGNLYSTSEMISEGYYQKEKIEDLQIELTNIAMTNGNVAVTNDNKIMVYDNESREWKEVLVDESFPGVLTLKENSTLIIDIEGYYWGISDEGKLEPTEIFSYSILPDEEINIKEIKTKEDNIAVIDENGQLWMQGDNGYGQLGNGTSEDSEVLVPVTEINKKVIKVEMEGNKVLAIDEDGSAWIWGENHSTVPQKIIEIDKKVANIFIIRDKCGALDEEGNVWLSESGSPFQKNEIGVKMKKIVGEIRLFGLAENGDVWNISNKINLSNENEEDNIFYREKFENAYYTNVPAFYAEIYINDEYIIWMAEMYT